MADYKAVKIIRNGEEYCFAAGEVGSIKTGYIDFLLVGGGGAGGTGSYGQGGGGAGGFIECYHYPIYNTRIEYSVLIGDGNKCPGYCGRAGGNSSFLGNIAYGGGDGNGCYYGKNGGSGGGGGASAASSGSGCPGCPGQGFAGGPGYTCKVGGGGGGAGEAGNTRGMSTGGYGKCSCISGECCWYAGGGGGGGYCSCSYSRAGGLGGGGTGGCNGGAGGNATYYGGGGGGSNGCGYQGIAIIRYHTDGSDGICCTSSGGTKYTCGDYTIHCFTTPGISSFAPVFA